MRRLHRDRRSSAASAYVDIRVRANAFLHHMVRNIAGTLDPRRHAATRPATGSADVLAAAIGAAPGPTAPPQGLYFAGVEYPARVRAAFV